MQTGDTVIATVRGDGELRRNTAARAARSSSIRLSRMRCATACGSKRTPTRFPRRSGCTSGSTWKTRNRWKMQKLGPLISPLDSVAGGNRKQHAVEKLKLFRCGWHGDGRSLHAPLVSVGSRNLLQPRRQNREHGGWLLLQACSITAGARTSRCGVPTTDCSTS